MRPMPKGFVLGSFLSLAIMSFGAPSGGSANPGNEHGSLGPYCPVGQVWPGWDSEWVEPGTIAGGGETFYALFDPTVGCACPVGFEAVTTDMFMTLPEGHHVPFTITVSMGLTEAIPGSGTLPWLPGALLCETPIRDFVVEIPKDFVGFGMALECDCAPMDSPIFLFFTIHSVLNPPGGFYTAGGGAPDPGRFLTLVDGEWIDLVAEGILTRGDLVSSASARCCELPVDVGGSGQSLPAATHLIGASPNPFNPRTTITYTLAAESSVRLAVYDVTGRRVTVLLGRRIQGPGAHVATWNGRNDANQSMSSGVYFYRLEAGRYTETKRMTLIR